MPVLRRLLLVSLLLALAAPAVADAWPITRKKAMWGPAFRDGASQFPIYADLGVGIWQYSINWAYAAPTAPADPIDPQDPAYHWPSELDAAIAEAERHGISVMIHLIGAPPWANGGRDWNWAPRRAGDFADFVTATERRYPEVDRWMIWSEPTKAQNFQPLDDDLNRRLRGRRLRGPRKYAQILDASYAALKRLNRDNLVIGGNTFTLGTIRARWFLPALRLPNGRRPRMDLFGHNPFTIREPNLSDPPMEGNYSDFSDLDRFVKWLDRYYGRGPGGKPLKIFISEFSVPTDHENFEFNFYVTRPTQARWLRSALRITRRWSRLYTFGYLGLYDDDARADGLQVERGLITREGERKPGYAAFRDG